MSGWKSYKLDSALDQAQADLHALNEADRRAIEEAKARIEGRTRLLKMIRRRRRAQGMVNIGHLWGKTAYWVRKDIIE